MQGRQAGPASERGHERQPSTSEKPPGREAARARSRPGEKPLGNGGKQGEKAARTSAAWPRRGSGPCPADVEEPACAGGLVVGSACSGSGSTPFLSAVRKYMPTRVERATPAFFRANVLNSSRLGGVPIDEQPHDFSASATFA